MTNCIVTNYEWRDLQGLKDCGIFLSTPSNEAAKMLDALTIQLIGWYDDDSLGGVFGTVKRVKEADPGYVLGPLLESYFKLSCHKPETCPELKQSLTEMEDLVKNENINEWEMKHIEAIRHSAEGYPAKSFEIWKEIVMENPLDLLSLRMAYLSSIHLGKMKDMKPIMTRVVSVWEPNMPMYGYIQGMYSFMLNELKCYEEAEKYALKGLEINPCDCWSAHTQAHVFDNTNRAKEGASFMEENEQNWRTGTFLVEHNYWHWALFYVEKGDYESALGILDDQILSRCRQGSFGPLRDAASLLYRLQLEGVPTRGRWDKIKSCWTPSEHASMFNDVHLMMNCLGAKDYESADSLLESCNEFVRKGKGTNWEVTKEVGVSLCEALMAFDKEQYDDAVEILSPVRDDIIKIGGSGSQRDIFEQFLIHAAIRSSKDNNRKLACQLIEERKKCLGETGVTQRLEEQLLKRV